MSPSFFEKILAPCEKVCYNLLCRYKSRYLGLLQQLDSGFCGFESHRCPFGERGEIGIRTGNVQHKDFALVLSAIIGGSPWIFRQLIGFTSKLISRVSQVQVLPCPSGHVAQRQSTGKFLIRYFRLFIAASVAPRPPRRARHILTNDGKLPCI